MDLRWPRVYRRSNVGLVIADEESLDKQDGEIFKPNIRTASHQSHDMSLPAHLFIQ